MDARHREITMFKKALFALAVGIGLAGSVSAQSVDDIKARGTLLVGVEAKNPPGVYRDGDAIVGYDVDVATYIANKLGVKVEFVDTDWSGILPALTAGKFDTVISTMSITTDRLKKVNYSNPYNVGTFNLLVHADSGITDVKGMAGKKLGVAIGSNYIPAFEAYNAAQVAAGAAPIELVTYNSLPDALTDLGNKRMDAAIAQAVTFRVWEKQTSQDPASFTLIPDLTDIIKTTNVVGAAAPKDNPTLLAFINDTIAEMEANGKLNEMMTKWYGGTENIPATIPANIP